MAFQGDSWRFNCFGRFPSQEDLENVIYLIKGSSNCTSVVIFFN